MSDASGPKVTPAARVAARALSAGKPDHVDDDTDLSSNAPAAAALMGDSAPAATTTTQMADSERKRPVFDVQDPPELDDEGMTPEARKPRGRPRKMATGGGVEPTVVAPVPQRVPQHAVPRQFEQPPAAPSQEMAGQTTLLRSADGDSTWWGDSDVYTNKEIVVLYVAGMAAGAALCWLAYNMAGMAKGAMPKGV
jgi:hypothetical protein